MVAQSVIPTTQEAKAGGSEFKANLTNTVRLHFKNQCLDGGNVNNVQYKSNRNRHYKSPSPPI
jgi:hypothetical protein